jgi:flagellar protein FliO/FliZ
MEPIDILKIILYLVGFCSLLFLTYVTTRYIGQKQNKAMRSKNISVVETVMLSADKRLHLVKAGKEYVLIASTSKSVEFLSKIDIEEVNGQEAAIEEKEKPFDFKSLFDKYTGVYRNNIHKEKSMEKADSPQDIEDEHGFRSNLNRLKKIVNINQVEKNGDDNTNEK